MVHVPQGISDRLARHRDEAAYGHVEVKDQVKRRRDRDSGKTDDDLMSASAKMYVWGVSTRNA